MIFNLKDLKHLELMAQLDNAEPKLIKKAAAPNMQLLPLAKDTLDSKILSLCTQLRAQSFVKQAHALEQRFLRFKTAGTSLYNLSGETGDQLINDAHPEGDVEMVEAADELGVVETILSRHTKIVEMVQGKHLGKKAGTDEEALAKEVASQFDYIADYLKRQFLNNMPEGSTLEPAARNFYGFASGWAEIASSIANKLKNSPSSSYAPMVIVKTMLGEHSFSSSYVPITNTAEDVHRLVEHVLNWFEDNRPKEKTAGLSRYVEKCHKVLAQNANNEPTLQDGAEESVTPLEGELTDISSEKVKYLNKWYYSYIKEAIGLIDYIKSHSNLKDTTFFHPFFDSDKADVGWFKLKATFKFFDDIKANLNELAQLSCSADNNQKLKANLSSIIVLIDKADKIPPDVKTNYTNRARSIISKIDIPLNKVNKMEITDQSAPPQPKKLELFTRDKNPSTIDSIVSARIEKIKGYEALVTAALKFSTNKKIAMNNWLEGRIKLYTDQLNSWKNIPEAEKENTSPNILSNINLLDKQIQDFYDKYLK